MSARRTPAAIIVLTVSIAACGQHQVPAPPDPYRAEIAGLVDAAGTDRVIEGRLAGGFRYGEWREVRGAPRDLQVLAAGARLQQRGASAHANAVAVLLSGDGERAIALLERIVAAPEWPASAASDLAAARLARWRRTGQPLDAVRALNEARRSIARDPGLAEGWFNRALALEALGLPSLAREGWRDYQRVDRAGPWAAEAARRAESDARIDAGRPADPRGAFAAALMNGDLAGLDDAVAQNPAVARQYFEKDLLRDWSSPAASSREQAGRALRLQTVGRLLGAHGEPLWQRVADELRHVPAGQHAGVARAVQDLLAAGAHIEANRFDAAAPLLESLPARLAAVPSLALGSRFWIQYVAWYRGDKANVAAAVSRLQRQAAARRFAFLEARCALLLAASFESLARYDEAAAAFREAIARFEELREVEFAASAHAMLAHLLSVQGDLSDAWNHLRAALEALRWIQALRPRVVVLANAVLIGAHHGFPFAALDIQDALVADARKWGDKGALARCFVERARLLNDLQMTGAARAAVQEGRNAVAAIADASNRGIFELDLAIEAARVTMASDGAGSARLLADVVQRLPARNGEFKLAEVYLDLGRARQQAGDPAGALQAWLAGIDVLERQRPAIGAEALRISFYSRAWELYEYALAESIRANRRDEALSLVERSRARTLRDGLVSAAAPPDPAVIRQRLPDGTLVLVFASLRDSLLVWALDRSGAAFTTLPWSAAALQDQVDAVRLEVLDGRSTECADRLAAALLGPFADRVNAAARLVVVPDGAIAGLPFAVLRLPGRAEAIVDRMPMSFAPSLSVLDAATRRLATLSRRTPRSGIFVGDPAIDRGVYPSLNSLPSARAEVRDSARLYPQAKVVLGEEATAAVLTGALGAADVLHFAGHAIADAEFPLHATLAVAPSRERPGFVRAADFSGLPARRTRVVILSACSTANARPTFGEGPLTLARPFLAAGVPAVVGTLWNVDDGDAAALAPRFHRALRDGLSPAEALRRAQLQLKTGPDAALRHPRAWSGFVVIGGAGPSMEPARASHSVQ